MASRKPSLEDSLDRIAELRKGPIDESAAEELRGFLAGKHAFAVAKAATLIADERLDDFCAHHFGNRYLWRTIWGYNPHLRDASKLSPNDSADKISLTRSDDSGF